jgi:membrane fusion protein (multidrug efflux system)
MLPTALAAGLSHPECSRPRLRAARSTAEADRAHGTRHARTAGLRIRGALPRHPRVPAHADVNPPRCRASRTRRATARPNALLACVLLVVLAACSPTSAPAQAGAKGPAAAAPSGAAGGAGSPGAGAPAPPPAPVTAMQVIQRDAVVTGELVGQVSAVREVPLRSQVTGTVQKILFDAGQRVKDGERLFVIDPRPYEATVSEAQAALADAQATLARARQDVARYEPLLPYNAIPRATYDAAVATAKSAQAAVDQRTAAVQRAQLDVRNTDIRSPFTGQFGAKQVEIGALVISGQTVLATVSTLDPVYVSFSVPEAEYVRYRRSAGSQAAANRRAEANPLYLVLPDGSEYRHAGRFDYIAPSVSGETGTLTIRTRFPNPENLLRPGMNVRVRLVIDRVPDALLVPQRAVTELLGRMFLTVIGPDDKAEQRPVTLGERIGSLWIVRSGIKPGERVVVDGLQKAPPGTTVAPTLITEAQLDNPAPNAPATK